MMLKAVPKHLEKEFLAYVEKHNIKELFSDLLDQCFLQNIENPKKFIVASLRESPVNCNHQDEINQLQKRVLKLENQVLQINGSYETIQKRIQESEIESLNGNVGRLEKALADSESNMTELKEKLEKLQKEKTESVTTNVKCSVLLKSLEFHEKSNEVKREKIKIIDEIIVSESSYPSSESEHSFPIVSRLVKKSTGGRCPPLRARKRIQPDRKVACKGAKHVCNSTDDDRAN